jgi:pyruvate/2-oxoglutarate dehydrogenase complex dihydrolipoamide acyltransferase (E2) component
MRTASFKRAIPAGRLEGGPEPELVALTKRRLGELDRLIGIGMDKAVRLGQIGKGLPLDQELKLLVGRKGSLAEFERVSRAVRQLIVLELELEGLFDPPDRDAPPKAKVLKFSRDPAGRKPADLDDLGDLKDRSDYDAGPLDQVVAGIREILGVAAPKDDPFAPPAQRKSAPQATPDRANARRTEPRPNEATRAPRKAAMAKPSSAKPAAPAMKTAGAQNAAPPAQFAKPLNRHQRRKAERRMRRNRGPPK